ncbi:MAG: hypothetical protein PHQ35_07125 [Phycisphaerae bacterium]|nr:hypothetical protein [Phycisphaerae bacterium]MDD5381025.1 hypothetical protein [Phycisphaerae bacterium]
MSKKYSNFFEEHVEKIVLAVVGLGCLWLFITRVLFSPYYVEYDNDKFAPGAVDNRISEQAKALESKLSREPEPKLPYKPRVNDLIARFDSALTDINVGLSLPQPIVSSEDISDNRAYRIPFVGEVSDVLAEHIRTVAYVPKMEVVEKDDYTSANSEPEDIDFVTVEAKFDVAGLYKRFNASFAGEDIPRDWRDQGLAKPVFASVQLQRQKLLSDGSWGDWEIVSRSRVDSRKRMFKVIEHVNDLPAGGIKVRLLQFDDAIVEMDMLQPEAYQIASAKEEWFPPSLHEKYLSYLRDMDVMKRREAAVGRKAEREAERSERRSSRQVAAKTTVGSFDAGAEAGGGGFDAPPSVASAPARKTASRAARETEKKERPQKGKEVLKTVDDIYQELQDISITESTDLARMDKPLLFWAYDDTVEAGESYRYRIRVGVFNPIAGTNRFREQDKSWRNQVILWSNFSDVTDTVDIPKTLYFFPREIQETTKTVTVQVSKYVLGYWYSRDFIVKQGELIGKSGEYKITAEEEKAGVKVPETVDYTAGAVVVDIVPVTDWSGGNNLHINHFYDLLYSYDGKNIERLPIKLRYWTEALQNKFNEIRKEEKEPKEPLRAWQGKAGQRGGGGRITIGGFDAPPPSGGP